MAQGRRSVRRDHSGVRLWISTLTRAGSTSGGTFGRGLPRVMPATKRLKVVELVIIAALFVVDLIRGSPAHDAEGVASLALVPVTSEDADAASAPVRGEACCSVTLACCTPGHARRPPLRSVG